MLSTVIIVPNVPNIHSLKLRVTSICLENSLNSIRHCLNMLINILQRHQGPLLQNHFSQCLGAHWMPWECMKMLLELMPDWFNRVEIRRIWWMRKERDVISCKPAFGSLGCMTWCAILLEGESWLGFLQIFPKHLQLTL